MSHGKRERTAGSDGDGAGTSRQRRRERARQGRKAFIDEVDARGTLYAIGGAEERAPGMPMTVLTEIAKAVGDRPLVLIAAASAEPGVLIQTYRAAFGDLGLRQIESVDIETHQDAYREGSLAKLARAKAVFFTGGDQNRITSLIGGSPVLGVIEQLFRAGGVIAGTSAGAAALPAMMLSGGPTTGPAGAILLGPGLGLLPGAVIDTHFGQRGRMDRLIKAVARQPGLLGIGIDEDTAVAITAGKPLRTLGSGSVRIIDGTGITYSSLSDRGDEGILGVHFLTLHALGPGDRFDLRSRTPLPAAPAGRSRHPRGERP